MPRSRREPTMVNLAEGIIVMIWLWAFAELLAHKGITFSPKLGLADNADTTPIVSATLLTILVVVGMVVIFKLQSSLGISDTPRRGRTVKEREPKAVKLAEGILSLIWVWALFQFAGKGGISLSPTIGISSGADFGPFLTAGLLSIPVVAGMVLVLRLQSAAGKSLDQLQSLSPDIFEDWVAARFRDLGYSVKVAGSWGDHGVDLVAEKNGKKAVVQCKNYKAWKVGEPVLRDLYGAMHDFGADKAYLVTTGQVTQAARTWAHGKPVEIWDGKMVSQLSKQFALERKYKQGQLSFSPPAPERIVVAASAEDLGSEPATQATAPTVTPQPDKPLDSCPKCGSKLVQRRNRASGEPFLACPGYPDCRYTRPLPS